MPSVTYCAFRQPGVRRYGSTKDLQNLEAVCNAVFGKRLKDLEWPSPLSKDLNTPTFATCLAAATINGISYFAHRVDDTRCVFRAARSSADGKYMLVSGFALGPKGYR